MDEFLSTAYQCQSCGASTGRVFLLGSRYVCPRCYHDLTAQTCFCSNCGAVTASSRTLCDDCAMASAALLSASRVTKRPRTRPVQSLKPVVVVSVALGAVIGVILVLYVHSTSVQSPSSYVAAAPDSAVPYSDRQPLEVPQPRPSAVERRTNRQGLFDFGRDVGQAPPPSDPSELSQPGGEQEDLQPRQDPAPQESTSGLVKPQRVGDPLQNPATMPVLGSARARVSQDQNQDLWEQAGKAIAEDRVPDAVGLLEKNSAALDESNTLLLADLLARRERNPVRAVNFLREYLVRHTEDDADRVRNALDLLERQKQGSASISDAPPPAEYHPVIRTRRPRNGY